MLEKLYQIYKEHPVVCTDSREITTGCLFFALKGEHFDGNKFALQAVDNGAAFAIVDDPNLPDHKQLIKVPDVLKTLQELALLHRRTLAIPVIGITGTNGKTTTKELLSRVLALKYSISVTQGNLNNHIGVPLTLLRIPSSAQLAVVEMGANHPGEIASLCTLAEPTHGLITNIGKGHLEGFGSLAGVQKTKGELYDFLSGHNGIVFYNADNAMLSEMIAKRKFKEAVRYGQKENNVRIVQGDSKYPFLRLAVADYPLLETQLIGTYNADNILAALAVGNFFGVDKPAAAEAIRTYVPTNNRSQLIRTGRNMVIMDAYNANPSSMTAAIENFARLDEPEKWLVLGDMLELGDESLAEHTAIIDLIAAQKLTNVLLVGKNFGQVAKNKFSCFGSVDELIAYLQKKPLANVTLLIKGSHSIQLNRLKDYV